MRGLRDFEKRKKIYLQLKNTQADIIFLQETHSDEASVNDWTNQWGGNIFFSHGAHNSRGVMILFRRNLIDMNPSILYNKNGRILAIKITTIDDIDCLLINIYGPNSDTPEFFQEIDELLKKSDIHTFILGGDFNTVIDPEIDTKSGSDYHVNSRNVLRNCIESNNLWDVWRIRNEKVKKFTWHRFKPKQQMSRLDYFLVSADIVSLISDTGINANCHTDHCMVDITWENPESSRGPGFWKFNNKLLSDRNFLSTTIDKIKAAKLEFQPLSPVLKWEMIKAKLIGHCKEYSQLKAQKNKERAHLLDSKANILLAQLADCNSPTLAQEYEKVQGELEEIAREKIRGSIFRSKSLWYGEGEKNSRYFFSLEKSRFKARSMHKLYKENNIELTGDNNEILEIAFTFYKELYTAKDSEPFVLINTSDKQIGEESKILYTFENINCTEIGKALSHFKNGKTPGCDGLTAEFYKMFWQHLRDMLKLYYDQCFVEQELGWSARRGVLSLIPKRNKDMLYIYNWRPITLLNLDYKILSKVLALRLQNSLEKLISESQTGFMKGRNIKYNVRKTIEIATQLNKKQVQSILFSLDFEKCFDSCKTQALLGSLKYFGFPESFILWVNLLFTNFKLCVQNNGFRSEWMDQSRGLHQGCCYSPLGFLLCGEIFSIIIKNIDNIDKYAIVIYDLLQLLSQFADDTDIFTKFKKEAIDKIMQALAHIEHHLGLKVNYNKSVLYRLGSLRQSNAKFYTIKPINWANEPFNVLGVIVHTDCKERVALNFNPLLSKVSDVLAQWAHRSLTLMGRTLLVNTLVESLFVHRMSSIELLPNEMYSKFHDIILKFVWKGRKARISHNILALPRKYGGIRLVNLYAKHLSLLTSWVKDVHSNQFFKKCCYENLLPNIGEYIWYVNLKPRDIKKLDIAESFWRDVLFAWCSANFTNNVDVTNVGNQSLWLNSLFVKGRLQINVRAIKAGVKFVSDIWDKSSFLTYEDFKTKFGNVLNWLEYQQLLSKMPTCWEGLMKNYKLQGTFLYELILNAKQRVKLVYSKLTSRPDLLTPRLQQWLKCIPDITMDYFIRQFNRLYLVSFDTKLRDFQYRINMRILVTNKMLCKWKLRDDDLCAACFETEDIEHLLYYCPRTQMLLTSFESYCTERFNCSLNLSLKNIIFNDICEEGGVTVCNTLLNILKQYLYMCRCLSIQPVFQNVVKRFHEVEKIERELAKQNNTVIKHKLKWCPLLDKDDILSEQNSMEEYVKNYFENCFE